MEISKDKQIEEMTKTLLSDEILRLGDIDNDTTATKVAEHLIVKKGYRKQSEVIKEFVERLYSEFRMYGVYDKFNKFKFLAVVDKIAEKMKGGAE